jgi:signal transduction histidine kinase
MAWDPTYLLANKILLVLMIIVTLWLAFWVYSANPKERTNRLFALMALSFLFWWAGGYFFSFSNNLELSLLLGRIILGVVSISFTLLYFFVSFFPYETRMNKILDRIIIFLVIIFFFYPLLGDFVVKGTRFTIWGIDPIFGKGYLLYYSWIAFIMVVILVKLFQKYLQIPREMRIRVQYVFIGFLIFILMNLIFNVLLPSRTGSIKYWQFGNYSSLFVLGFTAYAIVARELFGIRVILTQALVGVIAILLLWQAVISSTLLDFVWRFVLFVIFLAFGYFLVQSVIREIQRRAELQRLYEEVDKLSRAKSEFISIASHQLRTPLTAIKGYISMLIEGTYGKVGEKAVPPMEKVYQSNERLIKLVNDLLNVSRIESGTLRIDLHKTSLEKIISSVIDELRIKANEKNLYLKWQRPERPLPEVTVDPDKFRQVVLNIIDNCIKYTTHGGVTVKIQNLLDAKRTPRRVASKIQIIISDTGEGMSEDEIEKMFESFSRGKAGEKHWTAGAGLGLYIARKFTEIHGGKVWAESEGEGKGSTFYIELPIK